MFKKQLARIKPNEKGQSFMELGISLVFLLVLLSAMIDLGWALNTMIAMRDAVQEGAVFAAICQNTASIEKRMRDSATEPLDVNDISDYDIEYFDALGNAGGSVSYGYTVKVTLTVQHQIKTPFVGMFIGNRTTFPLTVSATDTILQLATSCH